MDNSTEKTARLYKYAAYTVDQLLQELQTSLEYGLSLKQVLQRQVQFGKNELKARKIAWWQVLWQQCTSPFIYLLIAIAVLTLVLGETANAIIIGCCILVNVIIGFYQEYKAERSLELLKQYLTSNVSVIREGKEVKAAHGDIVPGDIVCLYPGDVIPADVRFVVEENVYVDESLFTGESCPIKKTAQPIAIVEEIVIAHNMGLSGAVVLTGKAMAVVVAIGMQGSLASLAHDTHDAQRVSGFSREIQQVSNVILYVIAGTVAVVFLLHIILFPNPNILTMLIFCLALGISVIPEALPVVAIFGFARGATRLAKHKVLVKRLSAVEDLGGIQVLCTDKTGTLTENALTLAQIYPVHELASSEVVMWALLGSGVAQQALENTKGFDGVLYKNISDQQRADLKKFAIKQEIPFDSISRRSVVLIHDEHGNAWYIMRGAPEAVMAGCSLDAAQEHNVAAWLKQQGSMGARVLAVAHAAVNTGSTLSADIPAMQLVGLVSFQDPLKPTASYAIQKAKELGVQVKIISGDSREVCAAIARKVGLSYSSEQIITGSDFAKQTYETKKKTVETCVAFARVIPEQKYEIIKLLQETYRVGYMGDGVNDAPALKIAHVALAVDDAADIARDAADIILLHSSLRVVINGIQLGRETFANTLKYINTTLAAGFGHFYALACASLFLDFLPMLPVQLLLLNLLTDFPLIALSTDTVSSKEIAAPQRYKVKEIVMKATLFGFIITLSDLALFFFFYKAPIAVLQTNWFISCIMTELLFTLSIRTRLPFYKAAIPSRTLLLLMVAVAVITLALPFTSFGQQYLHFVPPSSAGVIIIGAVAVSCFIVSEFVKVIVNRVVVPSEHR